MLFTYYDTETSGLSMNDDVLSFSYMLADENVRVEKAETLYFWKEGVTKWSQEAYEVNGLSKEFLRQYADQYETNLKKMYIVMSRAELVGWNSGRLNAENKIVGFDYNIISSFLRRNGFPRIQGATLHDAMTLYGRWRGRKRWTSLVKAIELEGISPALLEAYTKGYFGNGEAKAHDSGYDVVCTAMVFSRIYAAGLVYGNNTPSVTPDDVDLTDWVLTVGTDGALHVVSEYSNVNMSLPEFSAAYPVVYKRIMENPKQYMQQEG